MKTYGQETRVQTIYPDDYKQHALLAARRQLSVKIFDLLFAEGVSTGYNVVKIDEDIRYATGLDKYHGEEWDIIRHKVTIEPVKYRDVQMPFYGDFRAQDHYGAQAQTEKKYSLLERLRLLLTGKP